MSRFFPLCLAAAGALFMCSPGTTSAEPVLRESIEWICRDSGWILTGKVVSIDRDPNKGSFLLATVVVQKTIKGKHADRAIFALRPWLGPVARTWKDEGTPMVFFVVKTDGQ